MSREIRYRVFDKACNRMLGPDDNWRMYLNGGVSIDGTWATSDCVLLQFTGLLDKNGVEIYQDDLLAFEKMEWYGDVHRDSDYIFRITQEITGEWVGAGICTEWPIFCKVVGNIHQDKHLLGDSE